MTKTTKKTKSVEQVIDTELQEIAKELNLLMQEKGVALQPFMRPLITQTGFKTGEVATVELVRVPKTNDQE